MSKPHYDAEPLPTDDQNTLEKAFFTPRNFNIVWGNDSRYWKLPAPGTKGPAHLSQVSWLEVTGLTNPLKKGKYEITFEVEITEDAFGWQGCPLFMMAKVGKKGRYTWKRLTVPTTAAVKTTLPSETFVIEVTSDNDEDRKIYFGLYEVWTGRWKGGLLIHGATVIRTG